MKSVDLLIADRTVCLRGRLTTLEAGAVIGALSADPVTWDELQHAIGRFVAAGDSLPDLGLTPTEFPDLVGTAETAPGRGPAVAQPDCFIDLPGRLLLACWDQVSEPLDAGTIGREGCGSEPIRYHLDSDWLISSDFEHWVERARQRRQERRSRWSFDSRTVLYGNPLLTFLVERCSRLEIQPATLSPQSEDRPSTGHQEARLWRAGRRVFIDWLKHRPAELDGRLVKTVLQADLEHLSCDLEDREAQWARTGEPPRGIRDIDTAFRFAGIGPHEVVLYEELIMFLIGAYIQRMRHTADERGDVAHEVDWLRNHREQWLCRVDEEGLMGKSPREIIDQERRRVPLVVSDSHDALHDDCPLCQMMLSDDQRPVFWRLDSFDGAIDPSMLLDAQWGLEDDDDDDEYDDDNDDDAVEDDWAETGHRNRFLADGSLSDRTDRLGPAAGESLGKLAADSIWQRVCIMTEPGESAEVDLFAVAACTGELIHDLKERAADGSLIDSLNRHVGNLNSALRSGQLDLLGPIVARFCDVLGEIEIHYDELIAKVDDLQSRLVGLVQMGEE